jgi:hypothetical protein
MATICTPTTDVQGPDGYMPEYASGACTAVRA